MPIDGPPALPLRALEAATALLRAALALLRTPRTIQDVRLLQSQHLKTFTSRSVSPSLISPHLISSHFDSVYLRRSSSIVSKHGGSQGESRADLRRGPHFAPHKT